MCSWQVLGGNARFQQRRHERTRNERHNGEWCEHLSFSGAGPSNGTELYVAHDVEPARIIDELLPTVWVKSDRPGMQLLVQIVFPRSKDRRTSRPVTTIVRGSSYTAPGRWQQLRVDDLAAQVARNTRALRAQLGPHVDPREAYIDRILLNVYGGPGITNVWIDDLDVAGFVAAGSIQPLAASNPRPTLGTPSDTDGRSSVWDASSSSRAADRPPVELVGSVLEINGQPALPRLLQYQGESLQLVKRLGFTGVWTAEAPSAELRAEAAALGLWLVCTPPVQRGTEAAGCDAAAVLAQGLDASYDAVLAWDLGSGLSADAWPRTKQLADQIRLADGRLNRPLVCRAEEDLRAYSRIADMLLMGRSPLGSSLELADYGHWLRQRCRLARPGTPFWASVQTQHAPAVRRQWEALGRQGFLPTAVSSSQIRLLTYTAMTAGARGLLFESHRPLSTADADTRARAATLELVNLELGLIEPWLAAGTFIASVEASEPDVRGALLRTDRARLLIPIWTAPGAQFVTGQAAGNRVSFVVPGVPESNNVYLLRPGSLTPLRHKRVTGGTRVVLDEFGLSSLVVMTQDPSVIGHLTRAAKRIGPRAAEIQHDLAVQRLRDVEAVIAALPTAPSVLASQKQWLESAKSNLQFCKQKLHAQQYAAAYTFAQRATRPLRLLEQARWEASVGSLESVVGSPAAVCFATIPWHETFVQQVARSRPGENRLAGGDFEDLGTVLRSGWVHLQHPADKIVAEADLASEAAHSGRLGLRLTVSSEDDSSSPAFLESAPAWMNSPPVAVEAGQWVRIEAWVRVPKPIEGSVDGLEIVDSLSGRALAERIQVAPGWKQVILYRFAARSGNLSLTFALTGVGEAFIDDVSIRPLLSAGQSGITRLPQVRTTLR